MTPRKEYRKVRNSDLIDCRGYYRMCVVRSVQWPTKAHSSSSSLRINGCRCEADITIPNGKKYPFLVTFSYVEIVINWINLFECGCAVIAQTDKEIQTRKMLVRWFPFWPGKFVTRFPLNINRWLPNGCTTEQHLCVNISTLEWTIQHDARAVQKWKNARKYPNGENEFWFR